jgi:hypothetical protein
VKARENPFASHRIEALPYRFPDGDSWEGLLERLAAQNWRGAILGPHGSAKTTLLEQIEPHLVERGFRPRRVTLRAAIDPLKRQESLASINSMAAPDFLLLDGAEQLTTKQWFSLQAGVVACAGCLITQHRTGRLQTVHSCEPNPELLNELVHELCEAWLPEGEAPRLFARYHGNIRECFRELYDRWAG